MEIENATREEEVSTKGTCAADAAEGGAEGISPENMKAAEEQAEIVPFDEAALAQAKPSGKVSIIVPVYNTEPWLRACLESLVNQTYRDLEILLVDDGSSDGSPAILDEYAAKDPRIKVFHKANGGVSSARNLALQNMTGDYVTFVDADDWIRRDTCEKVLTAMTAVSADVAFCNIVMAPLREDNYLRAPNAPEGSCGRETLYAQVLRSYYPCINNKFFARKVVLDEKGKVILFNPKIRILEDGVWLMQTARNWTLGALLKDGLSFRRLWSGSAMGDTSKQLSTRMEFLRNFRKHLIPEFEQFGQEMRDEAVAYYMIFGAGSIKTASSTMNRTYLKGYVDEMRKVDEMCELYIYGALYREIVQLEFKNRMLKNALTDRPLMRVLKKLLPLNVRTKLKNFAKKILS